MAEASKHTSEWLAQSKGEWVNDWLIDWVSEWTYEQTATNHGSVWLTAILFL